MSNVFYGTTPHDQLQHKVCGQCWGPNGNLIDLPSDFLFPDHANFGDFTLLFCRGQLRIVHWNASTQLLFYPSNLLFCHAFVAVAVVVCFLKVLILMLGLKKGQINRWSRHSSAVLVSPHYLYYHPTPPLNKKKISISPWLLPPIQFFSVQFPLRTCSSQFKIFILADFEDPTKRSLKLGVGASDLQEVRRRG